NQPAVRNNKYIGRFIRAEQDLAEKISDPILMEKNFTQDIHYRNLLENIIFSLTDEEKEDMKAFHNFFESVEEEFNARLEKRLHDHPLFGRSLLEMSHALQEDQRKEALRLQYDAIFNENWEPYIVDQTLQGILFRAEGRRVGKEGNR